MSVWTTRSSGRARTYVVIQHRLKGVNQHINGVRFRDGYAVVEKDSKTYNILKKLPLIKDAKEFPLSFLRQLPFITRTLDIKLIYGAEVYNHFVNEFAVKVEEDKVQQKVEQEVTHVESNKCAFRTVTTEELCKFDAHESSPSKYCHKHILDEPKLAELGIEVPKFMTKKERAAMKEKVISQLEEAKKEGKF